MSCKGETMTASAVLEEIQNALRLEGATEVVTESPGTIAFRCPGITGMSRWSLLAPISGGSVAVAESSDSLRISYALRFTLIFWFSLAITLAFWLFQTVPPHSISVIYPFVWLFGGNIAVSMYRFPNFLRRTLSERRDT